MRSRILALALTVAALTGFGVVNAPAALAAGQIEVVYEAPTVDAVEGTVTWTWKLTNTGDEAADKVVLTHTLTPNLKVVVVSRPCMPTGETTPCDYGSVKAGEQRVGTLTAALPSDQQGELQINGSVTWEAPATAS
jgi:uncharacterized repeat protein (TIGR01451 family)